MRQLTILMSATLLSAAGLGSVAGAATVASVTDNTCVGYVPNNSSPINQQVSASGSGSIVDAIGRRCGTSATAISGGGFTAAFLRASSGGQNSSVSSFGFWSDTFSITAPVGYNGGPIDVGVNFNFDALIFQNVPTNATANAGTSVSYRAIFDGQSSAPGTNPATATFEDRVEVLESRPSDPSLIALTFPVAPMIFSITPGIDTIDLSVSLRATVNAFAPDGVVDAQFDSFNTVSFAKDRPAFDVPNGFFVNNAAANIFNNYWIDPRATPSPIPLPAGMPLLLLGLASIGVLRKRS